MANVAAPPLTTSKPETVAEAAGFAASATLTDQDAPGLVAVCRPTLKVWVPASAAVNVYAAGRVARGRCC